MLPTIQLKNTLGFIPNEYITDTKGEDVILTLTSVDLELLFTHYDVYVYEYLGGYMFKSKTGMFTEYIDKWIKVKQIGRASCRERV